MNDDEENPASGIELQKATVFENHEYFPCSPAQPSSPEHLLCTRHFITCLNAGS